MEYSFLASIYKNTKIDEMKLCVESMLAQSILPNQIVIVVDGPVGESLQEYVSTLQANPLFTIVTLSKNVGLGNALREGMKHCQNEIVARMDTDDIMAFDRMEKQLKCFEDDAQLSIVGSNIDEFEGTIDNVVCERKVPQDHDDICAYLKKRCPFNHMSVTFKKAEVEKSGGYLHWHYDEDSYLWVRMYLAGCKFYNIQENLVHVRIDDKTFERRGGYKYYKSERDLFKYMYKNGVIGWFSYQKAKALRFILQVLMPNFMRKWVFKTFARSKAKREEKDD